MSLGSKGLWSVKVCKARLRVKTWGQVQDLGSGPRLGVKTWGHKTWGHTRLGVKS